MPEKLPERGVGLILGTARRGLERGKGIPLTLEERRKRHEAVFGQLGEGLLRGLLRDYVEWFMTRPKIRERIPGRSVERTGKPALY